jgi:hypothetical protein
MKDSKAEGISQTLRWVLFLVLLAVAMGWAVRTALARAAMMKTADTPAERLQASAAGTGAKVVVRVDRIEGQALKATLLERVTDAVYRRPNGGGGVLSAVVGPETPVVMGNVEDIVPGAVVQLAGTLDSHHTLLASQVVIVTGYVRVEADSK